MNFREYIISENIIQNFNNWLKNTNLIKSFRENNFIGRDVIKVNPKKIKFIKKDNGWNFYDVKDSKNNYLMFISSSDYSLVDKFIKESGEKTMMIVKANEMTKKGITPYYIQELEIQK